MNVTDTLSQEHQFILQYITLMQHYADFNERYPESGLLFREAPRFIKFIEEFADQFHHEKEEEHLFRFMAEPGVLTHCNPLPQMLAEHRQARLLANNMHKAFAARQLNELIAAVKSYAQLLKEHIFKEDNILYPMAEQGMSDVQKTELLQAYEETELKRDSAAIWAHYRALQAELEQTLTQTINTIS